MKEDKLIRIVEQLGFITLLMDVIEIELQHDLVSSSFTQPLLNNHLRRIRESVTQIKSSISRKIKITNKEEAFYEYALQFHQLMKHFKEKDGTTIEQLVNTLENYEKSQKVLGTEILHH